MASELSLVLALFSDDFWSDLGKIVETALLVLAGLLAVWVLWRVAIWLFDSARRQVEKRDTTLIPPLLALIGSVAATTAEKAVAEVSTAIALAFSIGLAVTTYFGAVLANAAAEGRKSRAAGLSGYVILVLPLCVLIYMVITSWDELRDDVDRLTAQETGLLLFGVGAFVVAVVSGVFMIRAKGRESRRAKRKQGSVEQPTPLASSDL